MHSTPIKNMNWEGYSAIIVVKNLTLILIQSVHQEALYYIGIEQIKKKHGTNNYVFKRRLESIIRYEVEYQIDTFRN